MLRTRWIALLTAAALGMALVACGDDDGGTNININNHNNTTEIDAGVDAQAPDAGPQPIEPAIACTDASDTVYGDPGVLPTEKGAIIRCSAGEVWTAAQTQAFVTEHGYTGPDFPSGAKLYRISYVTERGNGDPGYSSALVLLPDVPRAQQLPVIVASHGSRGQAAACAPSLFTPEGDYVRDDWERQVLPLVGYGYAVIAPDLAGYANHGAAGNPPSAYASATDVGQSTLDAVKALRNLLAADRLLRETVIVGHSQGGHTALSALALHETYGMDGDLVGVVTYAPLWVSQRSWGALFMLAAAYPIADSPALAGVSVWYHYTHSVLLDGPERGLDLFKPAVQANIQQFIDEQCWAPSYPLLEASGTLLTDLFTDEYANQIKFVAGGGGTCNANDTLCTTWMERFTEDRPHLTGAAAEVPQLIVWGQADGYFDTGRMACVFERMNEDQANVSACIDSDPTANHNTIVSNKADHVNQWIANVALGEPAPAACDLDETYFVDDGIMLQTCTTPPPNE
jgi:pimeloyl-ACP methyl ester carboxylesterase